MCTSQAERHDMLPLKYNAWFQASYASCLGTMLYVGRKVVSVYASFRSTSVEMTIGRPQSETVRVTNRWHLLQGAVALIEIVFHSL